LGEQLKFANTDYMGAYGFRDVV